VDFDFSPDQAKHRHDIDAVIVDTGGIDRAFGVSRIVGYDVDLDRALLDRATGSPLDLLDRVLIAERLAELGLATTYGMRLVTLGAVEADAGAFAVFDTQRQGPVRYGSFASTLLRFDGESSQRLALVPDATAPVSSGLGFPYARLDARSRPGIAGADGPELRDRWRLAIAAEIAGNAASAVSRVADYLQNRNQFGHQLSSFQALRHRIAEAAVSAEATRWMVRDAAFTGDRIDIDLAVAYAADTAARLAPDLAQMGGARSFALEFGLHVFTMRLEGLRLELGGADRLAADALRSGIYTGV
jgi:Acyl-CoA dehydrogenase, C-terminal domain